MLQMWEGFEPWHQEKTYEAVVTLLLILLMAGQNRIWSSSAFAALDSPIADFQGRSS